MKRLIVSKSCSTHNSSYIPADCQYLILIHFVVEPLKHMYYSGHLYCWYI